MLCTYVMLCYITCVLLCLNMHHDMLYNICYVMYICYITYVMLYNICYMTGYVI